MMQLIMIQVHTGGGVITDAQRIALIMANAYTNKHYRCRLSALKQEHRQIVEFVLSNNFAFTQQQLALLFHISVRTVKRDYQAIELYKDRNKKFRQQSEKLLAYINYHLNFYKK